MFKRALVFVNGLIQDPDHVRQLVRPGDLILAADGGSRHVHDLGLIPFAVIGDLDSLTGEYRHWAEEHRVSLMEYPRDKNETDLELALAYALDQGSIEIILVGALGGRLDHTLGNLALLTNPQFSTIDLRLDDGLEEAWFVRSATDIHGKVGDTVSLIPWSEEVTGITTHGLRWFLQGETMYLGKTRGISNQMQTESASVMINTGLLLVIHRRDRSS